MTNKKKKKLRERDENFLFRFAPYYVVAMILLWALVVYYYYYPKHPVHFDFFSYLFKHLAGSSFFHPYVLQVIGDFFLAVWICLVAYGFGLSLLARLVPLKKFFRLERWVFGAGLGLGLLSILVLIFGLVGLWYPATFWSVMVLGTFLFIWNWRKGTGKSSDMTPPKVSGGIFTACLVLFFILFFLGGFMPEIFFDSLFYHLGVPNLYRLNHKIYALDLLYSNFILTIQMLYGFALTLGNEMTAKMLHVVAAVLLALSFIAFGQRFLSKGAGVIAALLFFSMPLVAINVTTAGMDVFWSFFVFIAAYALIRALSETGHSWLWLAGFLTGLAASCKYQGLPFVPIAGLLIVWRRRWDEHQGWNKVFKDLAHFLVPAILVLMPYLIKNVIFHHNPLYPFGGMVWGIPKIDPHHWALFLGDAHVRQISTVFASFDSFFSFILHPWFITMEGISNADFLGPLFLIFIPLLFLMRSKSMPFLLLRRYFICLWVLWLLTTKYPRYGLPAMALLTPLIAEMILAFSFKAWARNLLLGILIIGLLGNFYHSLVVLYATQGWQVVGGLQTKEKYLGDTHPTYPTPAYDGIHWMNKNLPVNAKILFLGDSRSFYSKHRLIPSSVYDPQPIVKMARQANDAEDMVQLMRKQGITHIFFNFAEASRTSGYELFRFDQRAWNVFLNFWRKYVHLVWKVEQLKKGNPKMMYVYKLLSDEEANQPHREPPNPFMQWKPSLGD